MKLLVTIIDRKLSGKITQTLGTRYQLISRGIGTASSEILDYFGIGESEKDVSFCLIEDDDVQRIMDEYAAFKEFTRHGGGVAFTVPISNIGKKFYDMLKSLEDTEAPND
jgi:hypothetical protein